VSEAQSAQVSGRRSSMCIHDPACYARIKSVPSILVVSTVRLDIQIERSLTTLATKQNKSKPVWQRPPSCGIAILKKEKGGLLFWFPVDQLGSPEDIAD
jgi:inosine-uridine nucleoside N-ribohydrolase